MVEKKSILPVNRPLTSPTIRDVAKACGVSPMTVSFVLNNKPGQVGAETRARVLKAIRELGYRPHAVDRKKEANSVCTLGMVAGVDGSSLRSKGYYSRIADGMLHAADALGHNITLFTNALMHQEPKRSLRVYCDGRCDGLLVLAPHVGSALVAALEERGFPFVTVGSIGKDETVSCADVDNVATGYRATEYLITKGHRRIAYGGGPPFVQSSELRKQGYQDALQAHGIPVNPVWQIDGRYEYATRDWVRELLSEPAPSRPTAVFLWNDIAAQYAIQGVEDAGLRVPEDISIIGIDDDEFAPQMNPPLTTYRQPYSLIGQRGVEILLELVTAENPLPRRELLPAELIERESVAPPKE